MTAGALIRHRACIDPLSLMSCLLSKNVDRSAKQVLGVLLGLLKAVELTHILSCSPN